MRFIELTKGKVTVVDDEDYEYLIKKKWCFISGYAARGLYKLGSGRGSQHKTEWMHRLIVCCPKNMFVDHINFNRLDNRKCNLRICTWNQNSQNRAKRRDSKNKYKGVHLTVDNTWLARITVNKKRICLGHYKTEKEAARVYDAAAKKHYGEFAYTNLI